MAMIPPLRTFLNSLSLVFLIRPFVVSMTTNLSSRNSLMARTEVTFSSGLELEEVDDGLAAAGRPDVGDLEGLEPVDAALVVKKRR